MEEDRLRHLAGLVRSVRHDINNPLTVALGHIQLLLEGGEVEDAEVREVLEEVERELRRLARVVRRLDEISR